MISAWLPVFVTVILSIFVVPALILSKTMLVGDMLNTGGGLLPLAVLSESGIPANPLLPAAEQINKTSNMLNLIRGPLRVGCDVFFIEINSVLDRCMESSTGKIRKISVECIEQIGLVSYYDIAATQGCSIESGRATNFFIRLGAISYYASKPNVCRVEGESARRTIIPGI
jgi:hypothetical protein